MRREDNFMKGKLKLIVIFGLENYFLKFKTYKMKNLINILLLFFSLNCYSQQPYDCLGSSSSSAIEQIAPCYPITQEIGGFQLQQIDLPVRWFFINVDPEEHMNAPNNRNFHCDPLKPVSFNAKDIVEKMLIKSNSIFDQVDQDDIEDHLDPSKHISDVKIDFFSNIQTPCWTSIAPAANPSIIIIENGEDNPFNIKDNNYINVVLEATESGIQGGAEDNGVLYLFNIHLNSWDIRQYSRLFLHEFGHAYGLPHSFSCENIVFDMNRYNQCAPIGFQPLSNDTNPDGIPCGNLPPTLPGHNNCTDSWGGVIDDCNCDRIGNNIMGYNKNMNRENALTPGQVQMMHTSLLRKEIMNLRYCDLGAPRIISSGTTETWTSFQQILGNIIIEENAILNLECLVDMMPGSNVYIRQGAQLNIQGLSSGLQGRSCNGDEKSWGGVVVNGGRTPGRVIMGTSTVIRDAVVGISSKDGGVVIANGAWIDQCKNSVSIKNSSLIQITNCKIHKGGFIDSQEKMEYGIKLENCFNVNIENCTIHGMNKSAIDLTNTSAAVHNCSILDAGVGVKVGSTDGRKRLVSITGNKNNEFKKCGTGVQVLGMNEIDISKCEFKENGAGITVLGESLYTIEENIFACHLNDINLISSGNIPGSVINCNDHQGSTVNCIQVMGINNGVQINNEKFRGERGIFLNPNNFGHSSFGSASLSGQGTDLEPRANQFFFSSATNSNKIYTNSTPFLFFPSGTTSSFEYFFQEGLIQYPSDPQLNTPTELVPECADAGKNNYPLICNRNNNYSLEIGYDDDFSYDNCEPPIPLPLPCNDPSCFTSQSSKLTQIKSILNGGNNMLFELAKDNVSTDNLNLIPQVIEASPYVTWDVLGAILQNPSISDGDKLLVLQANGPYTENFIEFSEQFLGEEVVADLEIGSFSGSSLDSIIFELKKTTLIRNGIKNHLIISTSSEEDLLEVEQVFINSGHEEDLIDLYKLYSINNLTQKALDLNNLMLSSENEVVSDFAYSQDIFYKFLNEEGFIPSLEEISQIKVIADKHSPISGYTASIYSNITEKNIKIELPEGEQPPVCSTPESEGEDLGRSIHNATQNSKVNTQLRENYFNLSPNPASTEVNIFFKEKTSGELILTDLFGRAYHKTLIKDQSKFLINVFDYPNGVYLFIFKSDNGFVESKKLILNR